MKGITTIILILSVAVLSGCSSTRFNQRTVSQWIPLGTTQEDAIRIMKERGYESGRTVTGRGRPKGEVVYCFSRETKILKNTRWFFVRFKDGKAVSIEGVGTGNEFFDFLEYGIKS